MLRHYKATGNKDKLAFQEMPKRSNPTIPISLKNVCFSIMLAKVNPEKQRPTTITYFNHI